MELISTGSDIISLPMKELKNVVYEMPWENEEFYAQFLAQTHYYTFYSTRMLAMAAAHTTKEQGGYYQRCLEHIREEVTSPR